MKFSNFLHLLLFHSLLFTPFYRLNFGSSAFLKPSPKKLNDKTVKLMANDGHINWCGYDLKALTASFAKVPQDAIGAGTPKPIKLKNASVKIALGIVIAKDTIIGPKAFGTKCLEIIRHVLAPSVLAAITNSCSFKLNTSPRTILAILTQ